MEIHKGLFDGVPFVQSPNVGGILKPEAILIHYTAGPSRERAIQRLTAPKSPANPKPAGAHTVTGPDGACTQLVSLNRQAWHAGASEWDGRPHLNHWAIGLEAVNAGFLRRRSSQWFTYWGDVVPDADVIVAPHKHGKKILGWQKFPDAQIASIYAQCAAACDKYPDIRLLLGHDDVAPGRKLDPGPAFPLDKLRAWLGLGP